jgi:hypothetical protein
VSSLLAQRPFAPRDDATLLSELVELSRHHLASCPAYARIWPSFGKVSRVEELPWLHVGLFKRLELVSGAAGTRRERILRSSGTSGSASKVRLDAASSELQARSTAAILAEFLGDERRPLLVLDSARALVGTELPARLAAAMGLKPLASDLRFIVEDSASTPVRWEVVADVVRGHRDVLVFGTTTSLWQVWGAAHIPDAAVEALRGCRVHFVHSGGWKRLEAQRVDRATFDAALLARTGEGSRVIDFYGLAEQVGIVFPACELGNRHVPRWVDLVVRDPYTLAPLDGEAGLLQLLNPLALGAPYHSVLTEDLARVGQGPCPCGRGGKHFELLGRVPRAEARGCGVA